MTFILIKSSVSHLTITSTEKSARIRSYSGPYFPAFGLNTKRYGVSLRIQSEWGKYTPEKLRIRTLFT